MIRYDGRGCLGCPTQTGRGSIRGFGASKTARPASLVDAAHPAAGAHRRRALRNLLRGRRIPTAASSRRARLKRRRAQSRRASRVAKGRSNSAAGLSKCPPDCHKRNSVTPIWTVRRSSRAFDGTTAASGSTRRGACDDGSVTPPAFVEPQPLATLLRPRS
ncbi:hypothetical protein M885DRAFT_516930 [Pelagophyceae sp. CCMP2097]|nr:hypothetical protein M885DRAFT_516930 [Pelagophyceae sp. CCMP2097]